MSDNTPTYKALLDYTEEIKQTATKIGRLEVATELITHFAAEAAKTKSMRDKELYFAVIKHLETIN